MYSYHRTTAQPGAVGSCSIIAGNRVCSSIPAGTDNPAPGYGYGGPIGAVVAAPFNAAGAVMAAPFGAFGAAQPGYTYAPATGAPIYSYENQVGPQRAAVGHCDLIAGNRVCQAGP